MFEQSFDGAYSLEIRSPQPFLKFDTERLRKMPLAF